MEKAADALSRSKGQNDGASPSKADIAQRFKDVMGEALNSFLEN